MNEDDDFLRQNRMARMLAQSEEGGGEDTSVEDLRRARRLAALHDESEDEAPAQDDALMSEGTKEALKKAGALAALAGKWGAGKAKAAAIAASEKAAAAKAEFDAKRAIEADLKRVEAENLAKLAAERGAADREAKRIQAEQDLADAELAKAAAASAQLVVREPGIEEWIQEVEAVAPSLEVARDPVAELAPAADAPPIAVRAPIEVPPSKPRIEQRLVSERTEIGGGPVGVGSQKKRLPLIVGIFLAVAAAGGGAYWWSQQKAEPAPAPATMLIKPEPTAPPAVAPESPPAPVVELAPEEVSAPEPEVAPVAKPAPGKPAQVDPPKSAPAVVPTPVEKKAPAVAKPAPKAKPTPVAPNVDWQDKAQDDMAAFEKEMGIE